jgi:hypothetical protein
MNETLNRVGRIVGVVCAAGLASAWAVALWVPTAGLSLPGVSSAVALAFLAIAVFAGIASAYGHVVVVVLMFLASFFPVGSQFILQTGHWVRFIGWGDLGLLLAAVLMWATARRRV